MAKCPIFDSMTADLERAKTLMADADKAGAYRDYDSFKRRMTANELALTYHRAICATCHLNDMGRKKRVE